MGGPKGGKGKGKGIQNKEASAQQITAEQIIREAASREVRERDYFNFFVDARARAPVQRIMDEAELNDYRVRKRTEFENVLRRQQHNMGTWIKYATWECAQQNFRQGRSIFERALNIDFQNQSLWLKYIDMEMRNKFVNHARNLFNRVCQLLPRVDQFWYKYAHMEELLGNYAGARTVYDRWMEWEPTDTAWLQYVKFEERCHEIERARKVMERYVNCRPSVDSFLRLCKFEEKHQNSIRSRAGYERGVEVLGDEHITEEFYMKFAEFEERVKEVERARAIYKLALDRLPKSESKNLYQRYVTFEKTRGEREDVDDVVLNRRRFKYEEMIKENPRNYDVWFDYIKLEESTDNLERIREVYERAVSNVPPIPQKQFWRRYIFFWIYYATFEELTAQDVDKARSVYKQCLEIIPHKQFSFSKVWTHFAHFEIRQLNLQAARQIFGTAIGRCNKPKIYTTYADLEARLGNIDRCREIYAKFVENHHSNPHSWCKWIDFEAGLGEEQRAQELCNMAINQDEIDRPEIVWKKYIDLETDLENWDAVRDLFEQLLKRTSHFRVWISYADHEAANVEDSTKWREILNRGIDCMKKEGEDGKEARATLLEKLLVLEKEYGDAENVAKVEKRQPTKAKKQRKLVNDQGIEEGFEEVWEYNFPEDNQKPKTMEILKIAALWKTKGKRTADEIGN